MKPCLLAAILLATPLAACSDSAAGGGPAGIPGPDTAGGDAPPFQVHDTGPDADASAPADANPAADTTAPPDGAADTAEAPDTAPADTGGPADVPEPQDTGPAPDAGPKAPVLEVDPPEYTFSFISPLTSPLTRQFTIANAGTSPLTITKLGFAAGSSSDFGFVVVPPLPKVVEPGKFTMVHVRFSEGDGGPGTMLIESNDPLRPAVEVPLASYVKATINVPEACAGLKPSALNFGQVVRGNSKSLTAQLQNCSDTQPLILSNITRSSFLFFPLTDELQVDPIPAFPSSVPPGGSLPITVTYTPKLAGPDGGYFLLHTDDPVEPQIQLDVSGVGVAPPEEELGITIKLSWDANLSDVDSHFIMPGGAFFDCFEDCYFGNPAPDWGVQGDWLDDPFLDVDDVDGFGPEHINISEPQPGVYVYKAHYWLDSYEDSWSTDTNATVQVLSYGVPIATFGPTYLAQTNATWDVFTIEWPSMQITPLGNTWMVSSSVPQGCGFNLFP